MFALSVFICYIKSLPHKKLFQLLYMQLTLPFLLTKILFTKIKDKYIKIRMN